MRSAKLLVVSFLIAALALAPAGCKRKIVTVSDGEVVLCTYGEIVSDTTEQLDVPARKVGDYGVKTRTITCDLHTKLEKLYAEAQDAIAAGKLEAARKALAEVVRLDPTYSNAGSQLADIDAGKTPSPSTGADTPTTPGGTTPPGDTPPSDTPGDEVPTGPSVNLVVYMPDRVAGFVGQLLIADPFVLTRDYLPETPGRITKLVIVAEQFKDAESAKSALDTRIKTSYPSAASNVEVGGKAAYFGAKGTVSAVAFVDGAVLVVLEAGATSGDGASFKSTVLSIAEEIVP